MDGPAVLAPEPPLPSPASGDGPTPETTEDRRWQEGRLPLMKGTIVALAAFFFAVTTLQLVYLQWTMRPPAAVDLTEAYAILGADRGTPAERVTEFETRALVSLELHAMSQRYHQASVLVMTRVWRQYLGFITGMILALVGAVFILGKLREPDSRLEAEAGQMKYALQSASPGIWLATLGVVLMLATILTHHNVLTEDRPLYVRPVGAPPSVGETEVPVTLSVPPEYQAPAASVPAPEEADAGAPP